MLDLRIIDVAIGVIFVYLLLCIVCSVIRESIEMLLNSRAEHLEIAVHELLFCAKNPKQSDSVQAGTPGDGTDKPGRIGCLTVDQIYTHPLINVLYTGNYAAKVPLSVSRAIQSIKSRWLRRNLPSYIPPASFAMALIDLTTRRSPSDNNDQNPPLAADSLRQTLQKIENTELKTAMLLAVESADGSLEKMRENIEAWFNQAMAAVTSRYRRITSLLIFGIALFVSVGINVDTFRVADYLYRNSSVRDALVARATEAAKRNDIDGFESAKRDIDSLQLPIGWHADNRPDMFADSPSQKEPAEKMRNLMSYIIGWLVTAFAVTLGAPFWFDVLKKVIDARNTIQAVKKPEKAA